MSLDTNQLTDPILQLYPLFHMLPAERKQARTPVRPLTKLRICPYLQGLREVGRAEAGAGYSEHGNRQSSGRQGLS